MNFILLFAVLICFGYSDSEALNEDIIKAFEKDKKTYATYRQSLKELSCKLLTYSKLREMFENKAVDVYFVHPGIKYDKKGFFRYVKGEMMNKCKEGLTEVDVVFKKEYFKQWVSNPNYDKIMEVNMTQLLLNYTDNYIKEDL